MSNITICPQVEEPGDWELDHKAAFSSLNYAIGMTHGWHLRESYKRFHPVVYKAFCKCKPANWRLLVLEWPHVASDPTRIAFTQNPDKGERDLQTVTSPGKYLRRHFPGLKDHEIRNLASSGGEFEILRTTEQIVQALDEGPSSCMQGKLVGEHHTYEVYGPEFGWGLAVRRSEGRVVARALVLDYEGEREWVRSYGPNGAGSTDPELEEFMGGEGYRGVTGWSDGARLRAIPNSGYGDTKFIFPYIDGSNDHVGEFGDCLVIDSDGRYRCGNQDGSADIDEDDDDEDRTTCEHCQERVDCDDITLVDYYQETPVCSGCISDHFTYVIGRNGEEYYVLDDDAVHVGYTAYDRDWLGSNDIVELEDGGYAHLDDTVTCCESGNVYRNDDPLLVEVADQRGEMVHKDFAWQCDATGDWYTDSTDSVSVGSFTYHPDSVPDSDSVGPLPPKNDYDKPDGSVSNQTQRFMELT